METIRCAVCGRSVETGDFQFHVQQHMLDFEGERRKMEVEEIRYFVEEIRYFEDMRLQQLETEREIKRFYKRERPRLLDPLINAAEPPKQPKKKKIEEKPKILRRLNI